MKSIISSTEYGKRIVIRPARSRFLLLLITSLHAAAFLLLFFIDLDFLLLLIVAGLIAFSLRQLILSGNTTTHGLSLQLGESLLFQNDENSDWQEAEVLESFASRWLIVLRIRVLLDSKQYSLLYATDSINSLFFRRLVVYLNNEPEAP
ncbi:MAG: protein YgfX [Arenicellales bacterium]